MIAHLFLTVILVLLSVMNFVHTAKTARKKNWTPRRTQMYFAADALFAVLTASAITAAWIIKGF